MTTPTTRLEIMALHLNRTGRKDVNGNAIAEPIIAKGGRTGKKIHASTTGSSVMHCGLWVKMSTTHFKVNPALAKEKNLCEKCFPLASDKKEVK